MKKITSVLFFLNLFFILLPGYISGQNAKPLRVGYSIGVNRITEEIMSYSKSVGIESIEVSVNELVGKDRQFSLSDAEITAKMKAVKNAADKAGIEIWSVHMPYGQFIDLSLTDEQERRKVVAMHRKMLDFCRILQPKIILFHPSYYLGLNERETRKKQLIRSAIELNETVRDMKATMVIENMLGYELQKDETHEAPLCRSVEETVEIMGRLPKNIFSAVDTNHIKDPEKLIRAMGKRLKSVHIADGDGKKECHYLPCSGQGQNNWTEILSALEDANYKGPFMFECKYENVKDLTECHQQLYQQFISGKK
ncbi:MAG: sugar phosphate isomerase/epimerase family protein [Prolixibacteraceae bacterium]|jgi:hexosaminidase|nr:sugar phosphate isomerase/epimerase family protein [Prolixibacteraceae bacterium]